MGDTWLTYKGAARRIGISVYSVKRWRRCGMPMGWDDRGRRVVDERVLLAEYRRRLLANPARKPINVSGWRT